ncbi:flagellar export chaperone FliS [Novosphingobium terrae]|jgi:flagellin-specific chaperone FliS|uniref:flagellar export chaperone FliS n=1 Tax=Novosphingobium terrae TaxID=2726189 RepID=UPI001981BB34|nr:flagellar protein FliS [Novosphingobium terrae]
MLALRDPAQAYRRVDFEARVSGADQRELVRMCYERVISSLGSAIHAHGKGDNAVKSKALTQALSALTALQVGVSGDDTMAGALAHFYTAARHAVLDSVLEFDGRTLRNVRQDVIDIAAHLMGGDH